MKILIIKPSSLGDIVHGLQFAESLRQDLPYVHISWVVREIFAPLVQASKTVDELFVFQRRGGIGGFWQLVREIRKQKFDWVLDLQGLFRSGLLTFLSKGEKKAGRADYREAAGLFYHQKPPLPEERLLSSHALDILLQFRCLFELPVELSGQLEFASSLPPEFPTHKQQGLRFLLFPDSRRAEKEWPHFEKMTVELINRNTDFQVVWAGSEERASPPGLPSDRFTNLTGHTSLENLPSMIKAVNCVLANDSGPMHLAVAIGTPVLALFGPTDPKRFGPYPKLLGKTEVLQAMDGDLSSLTTEVVYNRLTCIAL